MKALKDVESVQKVVERNLNRFKVVPFTMWHEIFAGVYFCELAIFYVLRELIFAAGTNWFFLLGIDFCDSQEVAFK